MGGLRTGVVIGVLSTAVVTLGVAVVVLASDDGDGNARSIVIGHEGINEGPVLDEPEVSDDSCLIPYGSSGATEVEVDLRSSGLDCAEAEEIYSALQARDAIEITANPGNPIRERGWGCIGHPTVAHPLLVHCSAPGRRFLVLSLGPAPHSEGASSPPQPPPGTEANCGNLVESGAGTYNVVANGVNCLTARQMAGIWQEICFAPDRAPNPCPAVDGFRCLRTEVGLELTTIQCIKGNRAVTFENGA